MGVPESISGSFGAENESQNCGGHPTGKASIYLSEVSLTERRCDRGRGARLRALFRGLNDMFPQTHQGTAGWRFSLNQRCCYVMLRLNFLLMSVLVNTSVLSLAPHGTSRSWVHSPKPPPFLNKHLFFLYFGLPVLNLI